MDHTELEQLPPLRGCLYCHSEDSIVFSEGRKMFGFGNDLPSLRCERCHAVAQLDVDPVFPDQWRIRYRRVDNSSRYYYVAVRLGQAGWLSADEALRISTNGYVQRARVAQTRAGDLSWLKPASLRPPPPMMSPREQTYLNLRAVTLQETPAQGFLTRPEQGTVLDSGKFYVTDRKVHLLGQRRDWSHDLQAIERVEYDQKSWTVFLHGVEQPQHYRGVNAADQLDAQLITAVVEALLQQLDIAHS